MAKKAKITDRDVGYKKLFKRWKEDATKKKEVSVGILADKKVAHEGGITNVKLGSIHEFGASLEHPGGTPYMIGEGGLAVFLKKGDPRATGVTKPHHITIPERSFIRATVDERKAEINDLMRKHGQAIAEGKLTMEVGLGRMGAKIAGIIKARMAEGISPPLKRSTIRKKTVDGKEGSTPLIDTGQLRRSITWDVRKR